MIHDQNRFSDVVRPTARLLLISAALAVTVGTELRAQAARPSADVIAKAVDSMAARVVSSGVSPAIGVAVVMDGKTIFSKAYGWADVTARIPANDRTLWYLASTSKSYTGFATALLAHQGVFKLDAPITTLLTGVQWPEDVDASQLTLAHFLSHTHHLNDNAVVTTAAFTGAFPEKQWPTLIRYAQPARNDDLVYSNFGYNIAAMVIDRVRPEGWRRFLDDVVNRPAGMRETYTRVSGLDARRIAKPHDLNAAGKYVTLKFEKTDATMNSAGGHLATLNDLARWVTVQMDSGRIDGRQVFPREAVALSHRMIARQTREQSKRFGYFDREGWAAGWDIGSYQGERMVSRFGSYSTTRSHLSMLPNRRIGVVAQANGPIASSATDIIAAFVYDLEAGRAWARDSARVRLDRRVAQLSEAQQESAKSEKTRRERQQPLRRPLGNFAGSFRNPQLGTVQFYLANGLLRYRWGVLDGPTEVYDAQRDQLRMEVVGDGRVAAFDFARGTAAATSVELGREKFVRVRR